MKKIQLILTFLCVLHILVGQTPVQLIKGKYESTKNKKELTTIAVSQGDILEFRINSLHKRRGIGLKVVQHPGNQTVLEIEETLSTTKKVYAPVDAIYQVYYGGNKAECEIEIINHTQKPKGPGRGEPVYVRMADTIHVSNYVPVAIGKNVTLSPSVQKEVLLCTKNSETLVTRNFTTGKDVLEFNLPVNRKDDYLEQKLLSYTINLTTDAPQAFKATMEVAKAGIEEFTPSYSDIAGAGLKKLKKTKHAGVDELVSNAVEESSKLETVTGLIDIANGATETYFDNNYNANQSETEKEIADKLATTCYVLDSDGPIEMSLKVAQNIPGVPEDAKAIIGEIIDFPDPASILNNGLDKITANIKGKSQIIVEEWVPKTIPAVDMEKLGAVWIQSAAEYGKSAKGYWDLPGHPTAPKNGQELKVWTLNADEYTNADRKFKFIEVPGYNGEYYYIVPFNGSRTHTLDIDGGPRNIKKNGSKAHIWENKHHEGQMFKVIHLGNGKIKILTHAGYPLNLEKRSSADGMKIQTWEPQNGNWTEWYVINPTNHQKLIPENYNNKRTEDIGHWKMIGKQEGSMINSTYTVAKETDPLDTNMTSKRIRITIKELTGDAKAKLGVIANFLTTNYTDVIKYNKTDEKVYTNDFWTSYRIKYRYDIMYKDQAKGFDIISKNEYYSSKRPKYEVADHNNQDQTERLKRYEIITKTFNKE